jgi:TonB family protein
MSSKPFPAKPSENEVAEVAQVAGGKGGISWWWLAPFAIGVATAAMEWRPLSRMVGSMNSTPPADATATPQKSSQLGFSATHEGKDWHLVWNRDAIARLDMVGAMLTITDGGVDRMQFLSARDLAAGALFYVPRTSDLTFNLKVAVSNAPDIEEQIRVLGADAEADPSSGAPPRRIFGEAARANAPVNRAAAPESSAPPSESAAPTSVARKAFQPPSLPLRAAATPDSAAALPEVRLPASAAPQLQTVGPAPPPPRPAPPPQQSVTTAPQPAAPATRPDPVQPRVVRTDPAPLRAVNASWPRNTSREGKVEVRIRVTIDARGRVTSVTPLDRNVRNFAFVDSALTAARLWTFAPAMENGTAVPSESILTFKFSP